MEIKQPFKAYLISKDEQGKALSAIVERSVEDLPPGEVIIEVAYSSLNYKDALSATGAYGVTKNYPHVPGIDAAGVIVESQTKEFQPGDQVLVTGYDLGSNTDGGYQQYIRVPADWVVPLPENMTLKESMVIGTAGFTAAISVQSLLENGLHPEMGEVVVTGATGGVGSIAVALLAKRGFQVVAGTGKTEAAEFLKKIGAARIINREELDDQSGKPLLKARWAGGVDTAGGNILATLLKSCRLQGCIAACGLVAGSKLDLTVYPFILRGVRLIGIDSAQWPRKKRLAAWKKLANEWKIEQLDDFATVIKIDQLDEYIAKILKGQITGRVVVEVNFAD